MRNTADRRRILAASAAALLVAAILLTAVILPAEYGWDPLGSGEALGLLGMAGDSTAVLNRQQDRWHSDRIAFTLAPFESVEYKYRLEAGDVMLYHWRTQGEVLYEMHAEPDGAAPGYADSFDKSRASQAKGSYVAPFGGIHGWFWQNRGNAEIVVELETRGFYSHAVELRDGRSFRYDFGAAPQP